MNPFTIIKSLFKVLWWAWITILRCIEAAFNFTVWSIWGSWNAAAALRKWRDKDKPTHGNASFATDKELKKRGYFQPKGFLMCVTGKGKRVFTRDERSVLIMAPPGAGKSQHFIADLRVLLERPYAQLPFLMIGDAGNELFNTLGPQMRAKGYQIAKIDAVEPDRWTKYDVLSGLDPRDHMRFLFNTQLKGICEGMVADEPNSKNPHFVEFARLLLKCVISVDVKYEGNRRTISEMVDLLIDDNVRDAMLKRAAQYNDPHISATLRAMSKLQDKPEGLSMMTTSLRKLDSWNDDAVREVTSFAKDMNGNYRRGWNFTKMFTQDAPVVLFIRTGYQDVGGDLSRIIYSNAVNEVSALWDATNKPLKRELIIYVDEAGLTGYCAAFVKAFSRLRKVGVRLRPCFVGMEEFKKTYPQDHKTLLNGCDMVVFGGSNDMDLNDLASKLAGEFTVQSRNESESASGESKGRSEQPRKLIKPDEIRRLEQEEALAFIDNRVVRGFKPWRRVKVRGAYRIKYL
ncbi:type IV secretory system conjugative DNA transfer family protein [Mesorhizobium sp. BR-1-1-10]|uniref:type IV secretory system conjugative DNA transfer family protein n=1 Tax=Mesorhizobium sp. BR-1-1-10 TaxID=2876660 RepID=UPI001CD0580F|nr:type IV secretory system conjugative DNA transfer family protein [Mesorhizobium sp. BR-1-1-10]MBZ9975463.1 type IV secretory system conjugative DNA transfer family protein [Mesorhizobium sp. BR-1-1-10]